ARDVLVLAQSIGLTGHFDGGAGDNEIQGPNRKTQWGVTGPGHGRVVNASGQGLIAEGFTAVCNLRGGAASARDRVTEAGALSGQIRDSDGANTFEIEGQQAVSLRGGAGDDTFLFADQAVLNGTIDGGAGTDTLNWAKYQTARQVTLTGTPQPSGFAGAEAS